MATMQEKSSINKTVLSEAAEFRCSYKRILSYKAGTKRSNVSMYLSETSGKLSILPVRGQKKILSSSVENVDP